MDACCGLARRCGVWPQVLPEGVSHLRLKAWGDHFSWTKVTTCIHNVVVGKMWIDNYGDIL
eukprot:11045472-Prorocentrum_lima.AAC.1